MTQLATPEDWREILDRLRNRAIAAGFVRHAGQFMLVAVCCFAAGELGLTFSVLHPPVSPIWPPIGVSVAALILFGYRVAPAMFIASFLINRSTATPMTAAIGIAFGNTLETVVASYLVNKFARGVKVFERPLDVIKFVLLACVLSTMISATICVTFFGPTGLIQPAKAIVWATWWVGDSVGALLFAPFLILVVGSPHHRLGWRELLELSVLILGLITVCLTVFGPFSLYFHHARLFQAWMCIPFLIWAGFRFCQIEAAGATLLMFGIAIWGTFKGYGPFVTDNFNLSLMSLAVFTGVIGTATLTIAATVAERRRVEEGLLGLQSLLQETVQGKTRDLTATIETLAAEATKRMLAEQDLREINDRFQQLAESIGDAFWLMDTVEDRLLYVSPAYETIWGRSSKSLYADPHSWIDAVHPEDHDRAACFFAPPNNEDRFESEYRIVRPDGSVRHIWDRGFVIRDKQGRISRIAGLASDITARKLLEEELQQAQKWKSMSS